MQLSKKRKTFCQCFSALWKSRSNIKHFEKNNNPHSLCVSDITDYEKRGSSNNLKVQFKKTL